MEETSEENIKTANYLVDIFGGDPDVTQFLDETKKNSIDILVCENSPQTGINTYSTVNLSDYPIYMEGKEYPARAEIIGCSDSRNKKFANIISTCAFNISKDKWFIAPDVVYPDVVKMYYPSKKMKHILFSDPFLWEGKIESQIYKTKTVSFLLAIPISENEYVFYLEKGADELHEIFEKKQIDIFDLNRPDTC